MAVACSSETTGVQMPDIAIVCEVVRDGKQCTREARWWIKAKAHCGDDGGDIYWCDEHYREVMAGLTGRCLSCGTVAVLRLFIDRIVSIR